MRHKSFLQIFDFYPATIQEKKTKSNCFFQKSRGQMEKSCYTREKYGKMEEL
jgi:hypothetical protein